MKPDRWRGPGLPNPWHHPRKGAPPSPAACCRGREVGRFTQQSVTLCLCLLSVWEKRQVSTPETTMSSPSPPQTQALDQQRSTKAKISQGTFSHPEWQVGPPAPNPAPPRVRRYSSTRIGWCLSPSPGMLTRPFPCFPRQLLLSPRLPGLWLQVGHRLWFPEHSEKFICSLSKCKSKVGAWIRGRMRSSRGGESCHLDGAR